MCTVITKDQVDHSQIATEDFIVYKHGYCSAVGDFISLYQGYRYCPNEQHHFTMTFSDDEGCSDGIESRYLSTIPEEERVFVVEGAHAFLTLKRMEQLYLPSESQFAEFIVPKNARYYTNPAGNIVTSDIIFKRFIND